MGITKTDTRVGRVSPKQGTVVISIDTEQIWGYVDCLSEPEFRQSYPQASQTQSRLLDLLCENRISATWAVVGGLCLRQSDGAADPRFAGLPSHWTRRIAAGDESSAPLWYARSFIERLRDASHYQEIGLQGGLTHLPWPQLPDEDTVRAEIGGGVRALSEIGIKPTSFVYPREMHARSELLPQYGIRCYRSTGPSRGHQLGRTLAGTAIRLLRETTRSKPAAVFPKAVGDGLWDLPCSLYLYPMSRTRALIAPLSNRMARVRQGIEAAARSRGLFHYSFHPEDLAQSPRALPMMESIIREVGRVRQAGDVEVLTMTQVIDQIETGRPDRPREAALVAPR